VDYTLASCPRCLGTGEYGGFSYGTDGKLFTLSGVAQLSQQIKKILTEKKRSTGYGFDFSLLSGVIDAARLTTIQSEVVRTLNYLKALQQAEKLRGFVYLPSEEIDDLDSVRAIQDTADPRTVFVTARVIARSGRTASITVLLRR
jgi:hypothetical protein